MHYCAQGTSTLLPLLPLRLLPLTQVVLRGARGRTRRRAVGVEVSLGDDGDATVVAHADHVEAPGGTRIHPVLAFELGRHPLDRALDAEWLAAADAGEW